MKRDKQGVSTVVLFAAVVAICLVGVVAWTTHKQLHNASSDAEAAETTQTEEKNAEQEKAATLAKETADWKTETVERYGIRFKYPGGDDWSSGFGIVDSLLPGHEAIMSVSYTQCGPNCGFALAINIFDAKYEAGSQKDFGDKQMEGTTYYTLASKQSIAIDGVSGTRWEYTPGDASAAAIVYYYFSKGDFSYAFTVNNNGAVTDAVNLTAIGEKIVQTVQFIK